MSDHQFNSPAELDQALADTLITALSAAVAERGSASLVVSGGSTPKGLFAALSTADLPWSKITVLLADERWVPNDHADSNERMVKEVLLQGAAANAGFISLTPAYPDTEANLAEVRAALAAIDTFDIVILGMGGDMHTASLFPCCNEVNDGLTTSDAVLMTHPTSAPHARVTLSRQRLSNTRRGLVHIVGDDKWQVLAVARATDNEAAAPIGAFVEPKGDFEVWFAPKP